jgi:hypothetical protein
MELWDISQPPDCLQHTTGLGVKEMSGIAMTRCDIDTRISAQECGRSRALASKHIKEFQRRLTFLFLAIVVL